MSIAVSGSTGGAKTNGATSITFAYDVTTDPNRVLVVSCTAQQDITSVTFNGDLMALKVQKLDFAAENNIWGLDDPDVGSNNVIVNVGSSGTIQGSGLSFIGADTITTTQTGGNSSGDASLSITTTKNNSFVVDALSSSISAIAVDGSQIQQYNDITADASVFGQSYIQKVTAGAQAMGWQRTPETGGWDYCAVEVTELTASGPATISKWNGALLSTISKINGAAIATIKKINGAA